MVSAQQRGSLGPYLQRKAWRVCMGPGLLLCQDDDDTWTWVCRVKVQRFL